MSQTPQNGDSAREADLVDPIEPLREVKIKTKNVKGRAFDIIRRDQIVGNVQQALIEHQFGGTRLRQGNPRKRLYLAWYGRNSALLGSSGLGRGRSPRPTERAISTRYACRWVVAKNDTVAKKR